MFLIDLNKMYVKVSNGNRVWTHSLDEISFMQPDASPVHVRRGLSVAVMPFYIVHNWLWPVGIDMNCKSAMEVEFVKRIQRRLLPVGSADHDESLDCYLPF